MKNHSLSFIFFILFYIPTKVLPPTSPPDPLTSCHKPWPIQSSQQVRAPMGSQQSLAHREIYIIFIRKHLETSHCILTTLVSFVSVNLGDDVNKYILPRLDEVDNLWQSFLFCSHKKMNSFLWMGPFSMKLQLCLRPIATGPAGHRLKP